MGTHRHSFSEDPIGREIDAEARRAHGLQPRITKLQARQLAWLNRWSRTEREERLRGYYLQCYDCGVTEVQHIASMAAWMVMKHAGHDTWLRMLPGSKFPRGG